MPTSDLRLAAAISLGAYRTPRLAGAVRMGLFLLPAALLFAAFGRVRGIESAGLIVGLAGIFQLLTLLYLAGRRPVRRGPLASAVYVLYLSAWACLWLVPRGTDWLVDFSQALFLLVPLGFFAAQNIEDTGAPAARRARWLAERLRARQDWPADAAAWREIPEVVALKEAIARDASAALELLETGSPGAKIAALKALEGHDRWERGQPAYVLALARRSAEPEVRTAAVEVLAGVEDRILVESLAEFLRDEHPMVRRAAAVALFRDAEQRWPWVREVVRAALGDPRLEPDGALPCDQMLTAEAVKDFTAWAGEKGPVAARAAAALAAHFGRALAAAPGGETVADLRRRLADSQSPAALRLELAQLLQDRHLLDRSAHEHLLDAANPAPLRLLAADALLGQGEHAGAVQTLRDVGRLPNREIGLATADVLGRRLGVELGLTPGQPPPLHSRQAAMITRRVMAWAADEELPDEMTSTMLRF